MDRPHRTHCPAAGQLGPEADEVGMVILVIAKLGKDGTRHMKQEPLEGFGGGAVLDPVEARDHLSSRLPAQLDAP